MTEGDAGTVDMLAKEVQHDIVCEAISSVCHRFRCRKTITGPKQLTQTQRLKSWLFNLADQG